MMVWCHQATSHYLIQCWPRYTTKYGHSELLHRWPVNGNDSRYRYIAYWHEILTSTLVVLRLEYSEDCRSIPRLLLPLHFQVISNHYFGYWNANHVQRIQELPLPIAVMCQLNRVNILRLQQNFQNFLDIFFLPWLELQDFDYLINNIEVYF